MAFNRPKGSFVAVITPMNGDGSIDFEGFKTLLQFHEQNGTSSVLIMGSTGEVSMLSVEERHDIVRETMKMRTGKMLFYYGCTGATTKATIDFVRQAAAEGADGDAERVDRARLVPPAREPQHVAERNVAAQRARCERARQHRARAAAERVVQLPSRCRELRSRSSARRAIHQHGGDGVLPLPRGGLGARGAGGVPLGAVGPELGGLRGGRAGGRRAALPAPGGGGRRRAVLPAVHDGDAARRGRRPRVVGRDVPEAFIVIR